MHVLVGPWVVLKLEWNPLHPRTPPSKSAGLFDFISPFLSPLSIFPPFFSHFSLSFIIIIIFFCSVVATASSSSSASATTSSLASA